MTEAAKPEEDGEAAASSPGYEVGYGKSPRATRFRKGQVGNPKGRPRSGDRRIRKKDLYGVILEEAERSVETSGGQLLMKNAAVRALVAQVAIGHTPSLKYFIELVHTAEKEFPEVAHENRIDLKNLLMKI